MAMSGARIAAGTSHQGWPRAPKAIIVPARRMRPSRRSHRRGAPVTTPSAEETVPCPGGGAVPVGRLMVFPLAGVVGEDVDAGVAFGHVDHAAAVDQDVLGLVDERGRYRAAPLCGVVGDVVAGDVRVAGVADVVDLQ